MKICIDIQPALTQRAGVGRYTRSLVEHLPLAGAGDEVVLFSFDFRRKSSLLAVPGARHRTIRWCPGRLANKCWSTIKFPFFDWFSGSADLFHFPNFTIPPVSRGRKVVTIHDASFIRFPEFAEVKNLVYLKKMMKYTIEQADAIITISSFSADEIAETMHVDRARVFPVHLGVDDCFPQGLDEVDGQCSSSRSDHRAVLEGMGVSKPYILNVGTVEPRKNTVFLIDIFEKMEKFKGFLVIAGMKGWKSDVVFERIRTSKRAADIVYLDYVSDEQLYSLYSGTELFVFPSYYEGFGFTPLEAMACGAPVLASAGGALPEVLGAAARIVQSYNVDEWVSAALEILENGAVRDSMVRLGKEHAAKYKWSDTAKETWSVYRRVMG